MTRLQVKSLDEPDEVRSFPNGRVEIFNLDDVVIGRTVFDHGWRWSEHVRPTAGTDLCEYHHLGVCVSGTLRVRTGDGLTLDIPPNTVFEIPPSHDATVVSQDPWVTYDFAGMRGYARPSDAGERVLASILFTDIVGSTDALQRMGDAPWRDLLARFNERSQDQLDRYRGRATAHTGDGFLALFDGAARAVRCAASIRDAAVGMGLHIRTGLHTGEVELVAGGVRGIAVHAASRVMALADSDEILVSGTTAELAAGAGLEFRDRGLHELRGLDGPRQLLSLVGFS